MPIRSLYFTGPRKCSIEKRGTDSLAANDVRVETAYSAISSGTEKLVYNGQAPERLQTDGPVEPLIEDLSYPTRYGYAATGRVVEVGEAVDDDWHGRRVFAYNPHETSFVADTDRLVGIPEEISLRRAALLATAETAVTFLLDGQPAIGERVTVFGQGPVGLVTTALLAQLPLDCLVAIEPVERRRSIAHEVGADVALDPAEGPLDERVETRCGRPDCTFELSGNPAALDDAMAITGFDGRIVVGSWYGDAATNLDFGGRFHRHRLSIESSQVSTIAPRHEGRWSRSRRHGVAWDWLADLPLDRLITHEVSFKDAPRAYDLLDQSPDDALQVLLAYD